MDKRTCLCFFRDSTGLAVNVHNGLLVKMMNTSTAFPFSVAHVMGSVQSVLPPGIWNTWWKGQKERDSCEILTVYGLVTVIHF